MVLPRIRKKFRNRPDQSNLCFVCAEAARRRSFRGGQAEHGDSFGSRIAKCADRNGDRIPGTNPKIRGDGNRSVRHRTQKSAVETVIAAPAFVCGETDSGDSIAAPGKPFYQGEG